MLHVDGKLFVVCHRLGKKVNLFQFVVYFEFDTKPPSTFGVEIFEKLPRFISKLADGISYEQIFLQYKCRVHTQVVA